MQTQTNSWIKMAGLNRLIVAQMLATRPLNFQTQLKSFKLNLTQILRGRRHLLRAFEETMNPVFKLIKAVDAS